MRTEDIKDIHHKQTNILTFRNYGGPTTNTAIQYVGVVNGAYQINIGPMWNNTTAAVTVSASIFLGTYAANPQSANILALVLNPDPGNVSAPGPTNQLAWRTLNPGDQTSWTVSTQTVLSGEYSLFAEGVVQNGTGTVGLSPINAFHDYS